MYDTTKLVLEQSSRLLKLPEELIDGALPKVRRLPSMVTSEGLLRSIFFYMSKSNKEKFSKCIQRSWNDCNEKSDSTAYSFVLSLIVEALIKLAPSFGCSLKIKEVKHIEDLLTLLQRLSSASNVSCISTLEKNMIDYTINLKRVFEAIRG